MYILYAHVHIYAVYIHSYTYICKRTSLHLWECHYGGGGGNFAKVKLSGRKCTGTQIRLICFGFWLSSVGGKKRRIFLTRHLFGCNQTTTYAYLTLLIGSWNLQENLWCKPFWACVHILDAKNSVFRVSVTWEPEKRDF